MHNKNGIYEVVSPIDVIHGVLAREISQCNDGLTLAGVDHSITCMREDIVDTLKLVDDCVALLVEMDNDWHPSRGTGPRYAHAYRPCIMCLVGKLWCSGNASLLPNQPLFCTIRSNLAQSASLLSNLSSQYV